jgi:hypothetical protein
MVLMYIEEGRAAGSMLAHAQQVLDSHEGTLCQRIEGAIRRNGRLYADKPALARAVRDAQEEGLFLSCLGGTANFSIADGYREHLSRAALLISELKNLMLRRKYGEEITPPDLKEWRGAAMRSRARPEAQLGAAALLAQSYFDGQDILYPDVREGLVLVTSTHAELSVEFGRVFGPGAQTVGAEKKAAPDRGAELARTWIDLSKSRVLWLFDREHEGKECLRPLLASA